MGETLQDYKPLSISYHELEATEWPEDVLIGGGLLSRGDGMLIGAESKGGKSTFLNDMNRECLTGGTFLGFKVTRPLTILYCQAELRESRLKERLMPNLGHIDADAKSRFFIWNTHNKILLNEPESLVKIDNELKYRKPDVWQIDPMINFHTYKENDANEMSQFFRALDKIKGDRNVAVVMPHHFRKANINGPSQAKNAPPASLLEHIRGSSALRGWADTTIALEGRTPTEYRSVEFETRNSDAIIRRIIKYNSKTKSFDWHDPVSIIGEWAVEWLGDKERTTTDFIKAMLAANGNMLSNNRSKAFDMKQLLLNTKVIQEQIVGKSHLISVL